MISLAFLAFHSILWSPSALVSHLARISNTFDHSKAAGLNWDSDSSTTHTYGVFGFPVWCPFITIENWNCAQINLDASFVDLSDIFLVNSMWDNPILLRRWFNSADTFTLLVFWHFVHDKIAIVWVTLTQNVTNRFSTSHARDTSFEVNLCLLFD